MEKKKVLFVITSHNLLGNSGHKTGAYLSEITHPYDEFTSAGYKIDMVSPKGGKVPLDGITMDDPLNAEWMNDQEFLTKIENTFLPWQIRATDYNAIFYVGGHGAMFDLSDNGELQRITREIYEDDGVVGAVCHGVAGLINVRLHDGSYLVKNHEVTAFTNSEEKAVGWEKVVPFLLQLRLEDRGVEFTSAANFTCHVVKSGRLVTGQNPASAMGTAKAMIEVLDFLLEGRSLPEQNWCEWTPHERNPSFHLK